MEENNKNQELAELKAKLDAYNKLNILRFDDNQVEDELDLRRFVSVVWAQKLKIIFVAFIFAVVSVIYALSLPNEYKSEALLMPNTQESTGGLGAIAGKFGGLASLTGMSLSSGGTDKTVYALEVLKSRSFLYKFIKDNDLVPELMAAKGWSLKSNTIIYSEEVYDSLSKKWLRKVEPPLEPEPSLQETYKRFVKNNFLVSHDKDTGLVRIAVSHYSPYFAQNLVNKLVDALNHTIKQQDMAEANESIEYLRKELEVTNVAEMKAMFYQLIEKQQQTLMLTRVRDDYVLKTIDEPIVAERKYKPRRAIICILGTMLGGILGVILVFLLPTKNKEERVTL